MDARLVALRETVASIFANSTQKRYWDHTLRVLRYATFIGGSEGADLNVIQPAVVVHDIGMTVDARFPSHVDKSRLLGGWALKDAGYSEAEVSLILDAACSHHPLPGAVLEGLEKRVLFDADNMEIVGAFGALRWIGSLPATAAELDASLDLFLGIVEKCVAARGSLFFTETARRIGDGAVEYTVRYFGQVKAYLAQFDDENASPVPIVL